MDRTVAIIGAGQIGYAAALAFRDRGWEVNIHARSKPAWFNGTLFKFEAYCAGDHDAPAADVVLDTIAFDAEDVVRYDPDYVGRLIVISSASVYCDDRGRTLDEGPINGYPEFTQAVTETQSTVAPGPETYSTRTVHMENTALSLFGENTTILRPCAIYGKYSRHLREWWFIKRLLDGRKQIPLLFNGCSQFQTTNVLQIKDFAVQAAEHNFSGVFNISDTDAPSVREIGEAICLFKDRPAEFVDSGDQGIVGRTPWSVPRPFTVSGAKAQGLIHDQSFDYADHVGDEIGWTANVRSDDWRTAFPQLAAYPWDLFDYDAEDRFLASH